MVCYCAIAHSSVALKYSDEKLSVLTEFGTGV